MRVFPDADVRSERAPPQSQTLLENRVVGLIETTARVCNLITGGGADGTVCDANDDDPHFYDNDLQRM